MSRTISLIAAIVLLLGALAALVIFDRPPRAEEAPPQEEDVQPEAEPDEPVSFDPEPLTPSPEPEIVPVSLPDERVETGGAGANAPSDGGWEGVEDALLISFLTELSALPHYQPLRAARYLNYYGSRYTPEEILRIVNTDNDLVPFTDAVTFDAEQDLFMLVNKYHYADRYVPSDLTALGRYGTWGELRAEAYEAFSRMVDDASAAGLRLISNSPYRDFNTQNWLYYSYASPNGTAAADTYSARAGYSEHQTGLAVDIAVYGQKIGAFEGSPECAWVHEHAVEYGFILRYGKGMDYITGYMYEPWHFRYVGVPAARFITEQNLTFEEYYYYYVIGDEFADLSSVQPAEETSDNNNEKGEQP